MTAPQPPSVPAPPPAHTILVGQAPAPAKTTPSPAKAAKTPIVGRPRRPLPPGPVIAAAGTTAAGVGTASWLGAVALGASGPVGLGVAAVAAPAGYVAYRKLRRPPAARKALARTRPAGQGTAGRPSPLARLRGRRGQQAAGGAHAPQRPPGGPTPARRKGLRGLLPGGQRRSPGSSGAGGRTAAGSPSGGRSPGRSGGSGRVARFMPGARGRAARAAGGSQRPGAGPGSGPGGATAAGQRRRFGLGRRNGPVSRTTPAKAAPAKATGTGTAPAAGGSAPRTRAGRAWARRPGGARRAQAAASRSTLTPAKRGGSTPVTPAKTTGPAGPGSTRGSGRGVKAMLGRGAQARRAAGKTTPAKAPAKTVPAKTTAGTPVVPAKPGGPATVWSTRRKHRRNPARPPLAAPTGSGPAASPVSLKTGRSVRWWNQRWGRAGTTKHTPPQPPAPPGGKGGGVGPVPKPAGPKPAGPGGAPVVTNPADPAKTAASARKDAETTAAEWDASARKFADSGQPKAALAAAARAAKARAEAERNGAPKTSTPIPGARPAGRPSRRSELADSQWGPGGLRDNPPPQTDHSWAKGFQPGPEPLSADARTAARDRWQRRTTGGTGMSGHEDINARTAKRALDDAGRQGWANRLPSSGGSGHAGRGDINGMSEFAGLMHGGGETMGEAADRIERIAATTEDTPSNQAVIEAARTWAQQARALAAQGAEIAALSQQADATGHQFRDEYGTKTTRNMWGD